MKNNLARHTIFWPLPASTLIFDLLNFGQKFFFPRNQMIYTSIDAEFNAE